jgi:hypothetical protein
MPFTKHNARAMQKRSAAVRRGDAPKVWPDPKAKHKRNLELYKKYFVYLHHDEAAILDNFLIQNGLNITEWVRAQMKIVIPLESLETPETNKPE